MWNITFKQDTEREGTGTIYAVNGEFVYSQRVDTTSEKDITQFVSNAKEKYGNIEQKKTSIVSIEDTIAAQFNKI